MKKKKLFLALGLVFVMTAASMTGCGKKADKKDDKKTEMSKDNKKEDDKKTEMKTDDNKEAEDAANQEANSTDDGMAEANNTQEQANEGESESMMQDSTHSDDAMSVFTKSLAGKDEDGNSYFYVYNDDESFVALVMLGANGSYSVNSVGAPVVNGDGSVTIQDAKNPLTYTATPSENGGVDFIVHDPSGGGNDAKAVLGAYENVTEVIDLIKAIDNGTEIMNPLG